MNNRGTYSDTFCRFYDLIYKEKNYEGESRYIKDRIDKFHPDIKRVLELGCGTGNYSEILSQYGWNITGIEKSPDMIVQFQKKKISNATIIPSDLLNFRSPDPFDLVLALFNVIGYLLEDDQIQQCFQNVFQNLKAGGLFMFDLWNTEGVLFHQFQKKVKEAENSRYTITRHSNSAPLGIENLVGVDFELFIQDKFTGEKYSARENHTIRHFSNREIKRFAESAGLVLAQEEEFYSGFALGPTTWNAAYILRKP